ncbi:MAG: TonB-dependent receptor [bacterium]
MKIHRIHWREFALAATLVTCLVTAGSALAADEETTPPVAPSEYLIDSIEGSGDVGGSDAEPIDSQDVQTEAVEAGKADRGVSRRRQQQIEEIVVQARKRSELLEDTPVSVTALGAQTLRDAGITRLDQIQELVPNLRMQGGLSGQETMIQIRGVGQNRADLAFDPGVGVYVDGVFLPRAQGNFLDVLDVEQIEILRGPQGTLFGKNTVGGAINMTTVKPSDVLEGSVFVRAGNFGSVVTRGTLNIPIDIGWFEDKLFTRLTIGSNNRRGYIHNELLDEDMADVNSITFLGSLRFLPTEDVTIDLSGTWSREHTKGSIAHCVTENPDAGLSSPQLRKACAEAESPDVTYSDLAGLQDMESFGTWMTTTWDLPDFGWFEDASFKNLTSWRRQIPRTRSDVDGTRIPVVNLMRAGGESWAADGEPGLAQQISTEFQLTGNVAERFHYIVGYFAFWEKADDALSTLVAAPLGPLNPAYPTEGIDPPYCSIPGTICLGRTTRRDTHIDNFTWAIYSQASYDIRDWLQLTAGLRYTEDKKNLQFEEYRFNGINPWNIPPEPVRPNDPGPEAGNNPQILGGEPALFSSWTPMASLAATLPEEYIDGTVIDHMMGYFTYSNGFKGGGFNALIGAQQTDLPTFDPETLDNFEVGLKTIAFDQLLTINLAAFLGKYDDIQVASVRVEGLNPDGSPILVTVVQNAAKATTKGIEIEFITRPFEGFQVTGSLGLLEGRYGAFPDSVSDLTGNKLNRSGERFLNVPQVQSFLSAQYSAPVNVAGSLSGWITPRIEWAHTGTINYIGPEVAGGEQKATDIVNLRLSYAFLDDQVEIALWSRNVGDVRYFTWATPVVSSFGFLGQYYAIGRTFGGELSCRF